MLRLENVTFSYNKSERPALSNLSLEGLIGEVLLIIGHNGAGKSTFLKLINGILKPTGGRIFVNGKDTQEASSSELARDIAVTFQHPRDQIFASTLEEEVAFGPRILQRPNVQELTARAMELFGFSNERTLHPYDLPLSRQKLLTAASAVASGSSILAFDEPSAGLSVPERRLLLEGLRQVQQDKLLIIISHDFDLFLPHAKRVFIFNQGMLSRETTSETILAHEALLRRVSLKLPLSMRLQHIL